MNYAILILFWVLYFALHSALASIRVKSAAEKILGSGYRYYRVIYVLLSILSLIPILILNAAIPTVFLFEGNGLLRYLSLMLPAIGVIVISRSFREYRFIAFIGIKQESNKFTRTGILQYVRHPIYTGTILIVIGFFLFKPTLATLISVGCILAYLPIGIYFEEKKLIEQFGDQYRSYKREVPSVFPKWIR